MVKYFEAVLEQYGLKLNEEAKFVYNPPIVRMVEDFRVLSRNIKDSGFSAEEMERKKRETCLKIATQHLSALNTEGEFLQAVQQLARNKGFSSDKEDVPTLPRNNRASRFSPEEMEYNKRETRIRKAACHLSAVIKKEDFIEAVQEAAKMKGVPSKKIIDIFQVPKPTWVAKTSSSGQGNKKLDVSQG